MWNLSAALRLKEDGPIVEREPVTDADLADLHAEVWLTNCLRKGRPDLPLADLKFRVKPVFTSTGGPSCAGFWLSATVSGHEEVRGTFTRHSLTDVALRAAERLLRANVLKQGDNYYYDLLAACAAPDEEPAAAALFSVVARTKLLHCLTVPLPPLLKHARMEGGERRDDYPVFYAEKALAKAERFARKGARREHPVETGGMLLGPLCSCPETGEFFAVVCEVLEVLDAEEKQFSLSYTGKTWERIQGILQRMQSQPATAAYRLLGQCHGHNFQLAGAPCADCAVVKECGKTNVFVSSDDRLWSQAVFAGQPWQLCHIFGTNLRGEKVQRLFGLRDGRLAGRGYYVLPEFRG